MTPPNHRPPALAVICDLAGVCVVLALGALSLSAGDAPQLASGRTPDSATRFQDDIQPCILDRSGYIHGQAYGAIGLNVDWTGTDLACGGMTRPAEHGVRLVFASPADSQSNRLVFVIGIDRMLDDLVNRESAVNLTIIDERTGRFFGTRGMDRCWTSVSELHELSSAPTSFRVDGEFYCAGSIPSLSDNASVTLSEFHYSGRLTLDDS